MPAAKVARLLHQYAMAKVARLLRQYATLHLKAALLSESAV